MIDTLKVFLTPDLIPATFYKDIFCRLKHRSTTNNTEGYSWGQGFEKNLRITYSERGISIEGSLSRYKYGTNQRALTYNDFCEVLKEIADKLKIPLNKARVSRIDIAENLLTKRPVFTYYKHLGQAKGLDRYPLKNGIEYRNGSRGILIYDKVAEVKSNNDTVLPLFDGKNVMRIEYRLKNNATISRMLNTPAATVKDLKKGYPKLLTLWVKNFKSIIPNREILVFQPDVFSQDKGIEKQLMLVGIDQMGGADKVLELIKEARKEHKFKYPNQATNLLRKILTLTNTPVLTQRSDSISEIERKVNLVKFVHTDYSYLW